MFNTSISGLNGSQKFLDTTSNNIANVNSYGFKRSRAEFADIYRYGYYHYHCSSAVRAGFFNW